MNKGRPKGDGSHDLKDILFLKMLVISLLFRLASLGPLLLVTSSRLLLPALFVELGLALLLVDASLIKRFL